MAAAQLGPGLGRRSFLGLSAASVLGGSGLLAGCSRTPVNSTEAGGAGAPLTWWDHNVNLQKANGAAYDAFTGAGGPKVEYTYVQTAKLGQALQLAKQSKQLPDIHSTAGLDLSVPALIAEGWFHPIEWDDEVVSAFGTDGLVEGLHIFDGKIYTFPIFADKQYTAAVWSNSDLTTKAGIEEPPATYDQFCEACRKIQSANDDAAGFVFALGHTGRMNEQINVMAQAAGFEGSDGSKFATGEIAFDDDAYVAVFEFFKSLQTDKLVFSGSSSLDDQTARVRWAAGVAGYYLDGPWCSGTVQTEIPAFLPKVNAGPMLTPDESHPLVAYAGRKGGNYFISSGSTRPDQCSTLLAELAKPAYNVAIADAMAQPPFDLDVVPNSKAVQTWRDLVASFAETVFIGPQASLKNPAVSVVNRHSRPVKPGLGELMQGVFSGDVTDIRKELKKLTDAASANREQAIAKAKEEGAEVDADAWAFSNWKPRTDFTAADYKTS
ncbi:ABC transporter substrate-binding protein [Propionibacteriaceae bacterium Y1685]|uniref:ABC transporter substrate-binding protein n=1 Tax=Microlunatus sp. Y1700 TaxID=3418487 RepID=UPI003B7AB700